MIEMRTLTVRSREKKEKKIPKKRECHKLLEGWNKMVTDSRGRNSMTKSGRKSTQKARMDVEEGPGADALILGVKKLL